MSCTSKHPRRSRTETSFWKDLQGDYFFSPISNDQWYDQLQQQHLEENVIANAYSQIKLPLYGPILTYASWLNIIRRIARLTNTTLISMAEISILFVRCLKPCKHPQKRRKTRCSLLQPGWNNRQRIRYISDDEGKDHYDRFAYDVIVKRNTPLGSPIKE